MLHTFLAAAKTLGYFNKNNQIRDSLFRPRDSIIKSL